MLLQATHEGRQEVPFSPVKISKRKVLASRLKGTSRLSSVIFVINQDSFLAELETILIYSEGLPDTSI